ncbi:uncharacterized protein [Diadema setosum]|uniref:uncharacterized protein n=1 Tax=Diadema setosum TaxID=31175 RepID=UPI003B3A936D
MATKMQLLPLCMLLLLGCQAPVDARALTPYDCKVCPTQHPQHLLCSANVAFRGSIRAVDFLDANEDVVPSNVSTQVRYQARVTVPYKNTVLNGWVTFYSSLNDDCAIPTLDLWRHFLIAGIMRDGRLTLTPCDSLQIVLANLTDYQHNAFNGGYLQHCDYCKIQGADRTKYIGGILAEQGLESGYWSSQTCFYNPAPSQRFGGEDCETRYSMCRPHPQTAKCQWEGGDDYFNCFQEREDAWFRQEGALSPSGYTCRSECDSQPHLLLKLRCIRETTKLEDEGNDPC